MDYAVVLSSQAKEDLDEIAAYIANDDVDAAIRFGRSLFDSATVLARHPKLGVVFKKRQRIRYKVHQSYLIFYRINDQKKEIEVLRFWHGPSPHISYTS